MKKNEFSPSRISGLSEKVSLFSKPFAVKSLSIFGFLLIGISTVFSSCLPDIISQEMLNSDQIADNDSLIVTLEDFEVNLDHPYFEGFANNPYQDLVKQVYFHNRKKALEKNRSFFDKETPTEIITDQGGENSLIFTIQEGSRIWYDTLQNFVTLDVGSNNSGAHADGIDYFQPIGMLPRGTTTAFNNNSRKSLKIGLKLSEARNVRIEILGAGKELLDILVEEDLKSGKHRFEWSKKGQAIGDYWIDIFVDGKQMRQKFPIGDE